MGPLTVLLLRFGSAFILLLPFAVARGYRPAMSATGRYLLFGVTGIVLHNGLETAGLVYTTSAAAAIVSAALPALTAAASIWFLQERLATQNAIGIAISFAGVLLVAGTSGNGEALALLGNALVLGGLIAWVAFTIQAKKMPADHDPLVSTTAGIGAALLFLAPLAAVELAVTGMPVVSVQGTGAILYLGALGSALAYWLWNHALGQMDASIAAPYLNLIPALAVGLALLVGESIAPQQIVGGLIVALGVWLSGRSAQRRHAEVDLSRA
jgi:drug/metabolite transporter (DMT)-like permease